MSRVRKLTPEEVKHIGKTLDAILSDFPDTDAKVIRRYFKEAFRQNETGEILLHEKEDWQKFNYRYGADSVIGAFCEVIAAWHALLMTDRVQGVEFIDEKSEQVRGRDIRLNTQTRNWSVSVKVKNPPNDDRIRINSPMFIQNETVFIDADFIAFADFWTLECEFYDFPHMKEYWREKLKKGDTIKGRDESDRYYYADPKDFMVANI